MWRYSGSIFRKDVTVQKLHTCENTEQIRLRITCQNMVDGEVQSMVG